MPKKNKESAEAIRRAVAASNQNFFLAVASIFLLVLIALAFMVLLSTIDRSGFRRHVVDDEDMTRIHEDMMRPIGGDRDEGGCLIGAGYSWCQAKGKCLRNWEEPCEASNDLSDEDLVKRYISDNISSLAPNNNVNDGVLSVSEVNIISDSTAFVGYDDGKNFFNAEVVFTVNPSKDVVIEKFVVKNKNGEEYDLQACSEDSDCLPKPSECHPRNCINKKYADKYERPQICTMMYDTRAAYSAEDCACDSVSKECYNKNAKTVIDLE